jgi:hypothetical protein
MFGSFNREVTLGVGTIKVYDEFNELIVTYTQLNITLEGNEFTIDTLGFDLDLKSYYVIISEGLFKGEGCNNFSITNPNDWTFTIQSDQYNKPQYSQQYS